MEVFQGSSRRTDPGAAVAEALEGWTLGARKPDLILAFASTRQDPDALSRALRERFPEALIAGCSTAGELIDGAHLNGSVVVSAIVSPEIRWAAVIAEDLGSFDAARARDLSDELLRALDLTRDRLDTRRHFCLTFIDGLSMKEEGVVSLMADALEGVPLLGGSAGDDLAFSATAILTGEGAKRGAAIFVLGESETPFEIIKHQHYRTSPKSLVITRADVAARRVYEMDGYPALDAYARALGLAPADVTGDVTFLNPLTFTCNGEIYVRSIQRVEPDRSIIFYCGIEEGMVLTIGGHEHMESALERDVGALKARTGKADLFIACNCILRALEAEKGGHHEALGKILQSLSRKVIGFDTYGEQLNGLHINQTLVGIALRGRNAAGSEEASA